ncbi:HlyD family secretion protein [Prolixibacter sp. NT017]|uniref:HlyD family secretion protein n=1 Tax=Prolixibacter sp. NT017 TaxID=2652390 RepID=UPI00126D97D3|nr:HlyD family secretion protein [Prolixibacter sp. NT017]GET25662.1 secretion protein HlyD [Prolixibacter sp. NT017]
MEQKGKKKKTGIIAGLAAVILIAVSGTAWLLESNRYESTDNAQIDGNIVAVRSSVTAYVDRINFTDNQLVKEGRLLVVFDTTKLQEKVTRAEAALENAKVTKLIAQSKIAEARYTAESSSRKTDAVKQNVLASKARLDKAASNFKRINALAKIKGATAEQFDEAKASLQVAKSDYEKNRSDWQSALAELKNTQLQAEAQKNALKQAQADIKQKQADLDMARYDLQHAFIKAPCSGIVTKRAINEGELISAGQSLFVVIDNRKIWVSANFKETKLSEIKEGQPVRIKVDGYPDLKLTGKVESVSGATGAKFALLPPDNATGNFIKVTQHVPVRISLDSIAPKIRKELFPGLSAFVKIKIN